VPGALPCHLLKFRPSSSPACTFLGFEPFPGAQEAALLATEPDESTFPAIGSGSLLRPTSGSLARVGRTSLIIVVCSGGIYRLESVEMRLLEGRKYANVQP
jgi:hypothetical protein